MFNNKGSFGSPFEVYMRPESRFWNNLQPRLKGKGYFRRIETKTDGTPDVVYLLPGNTAGWIELKHQPAWPVTADTSLGLQPSQAVFLHEWRKAGGSSWILSKIGDEHVLVPGSYSLNLVKKMSKLKILEVSYHWEGLIDVEEFISILNSV